MNRTSNRVAFTLLELIVVVIIITTLFFVSRSVFRKVSSTDTEAPVAAVIPTPSAPDNNSTEAKKPKKVVVRNIGQPHDEVEIVATEMRPFENGGNTPLKVTRKMERKATTEVSVSNTSELAAEGGINISAIEAQICKKASDSIGQTIGFEWTISEEISFDVPPHSSVRMEVQWLRNRRTGVCPVDTGDKEIPVQFAVQYGLWPKPVIISE